MTACFLKKKEFALITKVHTFKFLIKAIFSGYTYIEYCRLNPIQKSILSKDLSTFLKRITH